MSRSSDRNVLNEFLRAPKAVVAVEATEFVADAEAASTFGKSDVGDASGLFGDRTRRLWAE